MNRSVEIILPGGGGNSKKLAVRRDPVGTTTCVSGEGFAFGHGPHHVFLLGQRRLRPVLAVIDDEPACSRPATRPMACDLREARRQEVAMVAADAESELRQFLAEAPPEIILARYMPS